MQTLLECVQNWWQARRTDQITKENVRQRVQRGAEYLDEADPDWYRRIDAETLELEDGHHCILGQLHGEFQLGLGRSHVLTLSSAPRASLSPVAYGFKCVSGVSEEWQARDYELLTRMWRAAVRDRQQGEVAQNEQGPTQNLSSQEESAELVAA